MKLCLFDPTTYGIIEKESGLSTVLSLDTFFVVVIGFVRFFLQFSFETTHCFHFLVAEIAEIF